MLLIAFSASAAPHKKSGFSLPDSLTEATFRYKTIRDLILIPVTINDSVHVNLILDTGCRNLVLFGKQFNKLFALLPDQKVQFSGLGSGESVSGGLSLNNNVSIDAVRGENIPIVIIPDQNLFGSFQSVDGIIGYDIFMKFEVELNLTHRIITFRPAHTAEISPSYQKIPIRIEDSRPIIQSTVFFRGSDGQTCDLMIDTGSSLGLLLKTTNLDKFPTGTQTRVLGRGLNGTIEGTEAIVEKLLLNKIELKFITVGIIYSPWHNYASIGMQVMKDYSIVLNYCKAYAGFKKT